MITYIENENFGYSVACDGAWAAVGNPNLLRWNATSSLIRTGSIEIYKYNNNTDTHIKKTVIYRPITNAENTFLTTEGINTVPTGPDYILHTELTGSIILTANSDLLLDVGLYFTASEDGYGRAIDIFDSLLVVGDKYFTSNTIIGTGSFQYTGSGTVDFFDLTKLDVDPYIKRAQPIINYSSSVGGFLNYNITVPSGQGFGYASLVYSDTINGIYQPANTIPVSNEGGIYTVFTKLSAALSPLFVKSIGVIVTNPYISSVNNPTPAVSESFGHDVSVNGKWLAVSSIHANGNKGAVYIYTKFNPSDIQWFLYQTINAPSDIQSGDAFGYSLDINKASGSFSGSLVIGSLKPSSSKAYVYELIGPTWKPTFTLSPNDTQIYPLTFFPNDPILYGTYPNTSDSFGYDVAIFKNTIVVGAPTDRLFYEYSGSSVYRQGAAYFFERCANTSSGYYLARKSYGGEDTEKNNLFGLSVSAFNGYAVVGSPKIDLDIQNWSPINPICYLRGSLYQKHYCDVDDTSEQINGQYALYNQTTGSITGESFLDWDIVNVYQTKKRFLEPYRTYGYCVDISSDFVTVGSPMFISGSDRIMDFTIGTGSFTGSVNDLGELSGKSYIYNLKNLKSEYYIGNVFYRNGKIVIMTSGSSANNILTNDVSAEDEYTIDFKSKQVVYEKQIVCSVEPGEFNVSTNPTAITLPTSSYDINKNGKFDFQDVDTILRYMMYRNTTVNGTPSTDWSSSILNTATDEETIVYNYNASKWSGTDFLFSQSFSMINNTLFTELDLNSDNKIDSNDMHILWKYFINRLTQKNYETYVTPNSNKKYLSDIIDFLNERTRKGIAPNIVTDFLNYSALSKNDPTGSFLAPTVTTIGLYDGTELIMVAKLGSPIKITPDFPINFIVRMDF